MPLTTEQILTTINNTMLRLGFTYTVTEDNIDQIGIVQPEQVNQLVNAINPIIHDMFFSNLGNTSFLGKLRTKLDGGSTSRHITFGFYDGDTDGTPNTLNALVTTNNPYNHNNTTIISQNVRYSPFITTDKREFAKHFTFRSLANYMNRVIEHLNDSMNTTILDNLITTLNSNTSKFISNTTTDSPLSQVITAGQAFRAGAIEETFANIPTNIDTRIYPSDFLYLCKPSDIDWYYSLHYRPEWIERHPVRNSSQNNDRYLIPLDAIVIEEYNRSIEAQKIPNIPTRINTFFNSDLTISLDLSYPIYHISNN